MIEVPSASLTGDDPQPEKGLLPWFALRVRANGEDKPQALLVRKGYETFLPTFLDCRPYKDRIKKVQAPLFPGYLFCRLNPDAHLPVVSTPGVSAIVSLGGKPFPVAESEIAAIQRVVQAGVSVIPWPYLKAGDPVTIVFGKFAGISGLLVRERGADRLVLSVNVLESSVSVELDRAWIRPVHPQTAAAGL